MQTQVRTKWGACLSASFLQSHRQEQISIPQSSALVLLALATDAVKDAPGFSTAVTTDYLLGHISCFGPSSLLKNLYAYNNTENKSWPLVPGAYAAC